METKTRSSNIELLRIIAMLMIVMSHYAWHGVIKCLSENYQFEGYSEGSISNRIWTCILTPGGEVGVAIFFIISGFFLVEKKRGKLKKVVFECIFYGIILAIIAIILYICKAPILITDKVDFATDLMTMLFNPATSGIWWFVTSYVLLMLFSPVLNGLLHKLNEGGIILTLILCWVIWYSIPSILGEQYFEFEKAIFFYYIGAYIKIRFKNAHEEKHDNKNTYLIFALTFWVLFSVCSYFDFKYSVTEISIKYKLIVKCLVLLKTGLFTPLCAYSFFMYFLKLNIKNSKAINTVAATTFGVYLIHDSFIMRALIWYNLDIAGMQYTKVLYPLYAILTILTVFAVCSCIDLIRLKFFEPKALRWADRKIETWKKKYMITDVKQ